ncbi:MAG: acetate/propionate family kinase [Chitinophagaceae bacterium]|nr:acetate/propionate family kinase [Chitinophagaceae bacterium]
MKLKTNKILTINSGSSSIKFALFDAAANLKKELYGKIERIGFSDAVLTYQDLVTDKTGKHIIGNTSAVKFLIDWLKEYIDIASISAIGHRVVHGMKHIEPELVSLELLDELNRISVYDPDHLPQEIEMIELFRKLYPDTLQLACFDTFFHAAMPRIAKLLPIPRRYDAMGIQRYGFHGLSYAYLMEELTHLAGHETAKGKIILAHLGNGASLAAVKDGKSIDTSMGFTPTSGLVMGTRTGDLEPGVAWFLMQSEKLNPEQFSNLINHQSGLLGISETSSDMQDLLVHQHKDNRAAEAVELFCYQTKKWIGSFATVLEGLDTLVFAGGIGENAPEVRSRICNGLQFLGIELDEKRNTENNSIISTDKSRVTVRVIETNEELMVAKLVHKILNSTGKK